MLKFIITFCLLFLSLLTFSQKYIKPFAGISYSGRILTSDNSARKDSLDNADKMKIFPSAGVQFLFEKTQGREFYFGINYLENGFMRERLNYKFLDSVYNLGKIFDQSQAAQKDAFFTYHFKYLELPVGFNFQVSPRKYMNTFTSWFNIGITPQILIKQNMTIFLSGFSMKGKSHFKLDDIGYDETKINLALQSGGRFDINVKGKFWVTADALMRIQMLHSAKSANEKIRIWHFTANLGLRYEIGDY